MTLLSPLALFAALLAIPIVLLYMLRLRRREVMVSSHFLWRQVVQDNEANTPWQKLRRNLLLLLQLLILALLVLALARPAQVVETLSAGKTVVLLDATASMNATDVNGATRFEAAKTRARELVASLGANDEMTIIRVSDVTESLIPYTGDASALRIALNAAQPGFGGGDWATALTLAAAGAEGAENFNILVISDGNIPAEAGKLPEHLPQPVYLPVGAFADNIALSALATRALPGQAPQLFAQVQNYGAQTAEVSLVVRLDGELWESASQTVAGSSQRSFVFAIDREFQTLQAELILGTGAVDYLTLDNTAYATAAVESGRRVLIMSDRDNLFLEQVFRSLPGVTPLKGNPVSGLPTRKYDAYVFDGWLPETLPDGDIFIINPPRSTALFTLGEVTQTVGNIALTERGHPLLTYVDFRTVNVREFRPVLGAGWATPLVSAEGGALLLAGDSDGRQIAILPFDLRASDLPLQIAFPILMANAIEWFAPTSVLGNTTNLNVGDTLAVRPVAGTTRASITLPDGTTRELAPEASIFTETRQPGLYTLTIEHETGTQAYPFAINLFSTGESAIVPAETIDLGGGVRPEDADAQLSLREWWQPLALIALGILLLEWYLYHRRMQIPTAARPLGRSTAR